MFFIFNFDKVEPMGHSHILVCDLFFIMNITYYLTLKLINALYIALVTFLYSCNSYTFFPCIFSCRNGNPDSHGYLQPLKVIIALELSKLEHYSYTGPLCPAAMAIFLL